MLCYGFKKERVSGNYMIWLPHYINKSPPEVKLAEFHLVVPELRTLI